MTARYRRRPATVEAIQYTSQTCEEITRGWLGADHSDRDRDECGEAMICVPTPFGVFQAAPGDWIVRHAGERLEVLSEAEFAALYEPAEGE